MVRPSASPSCALLLLADHLPPLAVGRDRRCLERRQFFAIRVPLFNCGRNVLPLALQHGGAVRRAGAGDAPINRLLIGLRDALLPRDALHQRLHFSAAIPDEVPPHDASGGGGISVLVLRRVGFPVPRFRICNPRHERRGIHRDRPPSTPHAASPPTRVCKSVSTIARRGARTSTASR